ncbi:MAG: phage tail protein [Ectothiorhodospiraceae bacterium]|nr:phage tail protein [Ectothiorhodospiraceae bacterium]
MMMALGLFVFDVPTAAYQELQRSTNWRHAMQNRVGQRPAYQYLGPGEDTIRLSGVLMPEFTGGRVSLDLIRVMAEGGRAWPLVEGTGRIYGLWAVTRVDETDSVFFRDGVPRRIDFELALTRVDDDRIDLLGTAANAGLGAVTRAMSRTANRVRDRLEIPRP